MSERTSERRHTPRRCRPEDHGIVAARVRPGHHAAVIDVGDGGALIETGYRLLPGSAVELQVDTTAHHLAIRGRVLRCTVSKVQPSSVSYRGAIGFDRRHAWVPEEGGGYWVPESATRPALGFRADATPQVV